jgi:selenocysteine lyase/cysteine desulfurase
MDFLELERDSAAFTAWRNRAFPSFQQKVFLAHASVVPIPHAVEEALLEYVSRIARRGQFDFVHRAEYNACRERVARLLGGDALPDEVAFAGSTSHALGTVATSLPWKPGDNCIVADGDFPANVVIWKNLEHTHGIETRLIPYRPQMKITVEDLEPLIDERTRIVSLSSANFLSGYPLDTLSIGRYLHERGILFCVDGIQTMGALPMDITHVDFVCADAHKWLLGPCGVAVLWARQSTWQHTRPAILGWLATQDRDNWFTYDTTPIASAERFQPGERNWLGIVGLNAALRLLEEVGLENIARRVTHLRDYTAQRLQEIGCKLLWPGAPDLPGGIVTFQPPVDDIPTLHKKLDERYVLSLRQDPHGAHWMRSSAHFMNTEQDIDGMVAEIRASVAAS